VSITEHELLLAKKIGYKIGNRWSLVETEDLISELTLWLFENAETVERYRTEEGGEGKLFIALRRFAAKYAAREQATRSGGPLNVSDEYTVDQIERAMPLMFEIEPEMLANGNSDPFKNGLALAILTDIRGAFYDQPAEVREILTLRYRDGMNLAEIGALTGVTDRGAKRRLDRALLRVLESVEGRGA
jgi:RNA polymerase sigma factor (sigma-70 family)